MDIDTVLNHAIDMRKDTKLLKKFTFEHIKYIQTFKLKLCKKTDQAKLHPKRYCSFTVDEAGQAAVCFPDLMVKAIDGRGHALKSWLIVSPELLNLSTFSLPTMTEKHKTSVNIVIEIIPS